jgi:hypothetical protein
MCELVAALVLLILVLDTEVALGLVLTGLDLAVVLVASLVISELRGLVEGLVGLLVVVAGEVLGRQGRRAKITVKVVRPRCAAGAPP